MNSVDKSTLDGLLEWVETMWPNHHPWDIANRLNATYGFEGRDALTATAIWNLHHAARRLDRDRRQA